MRILPQLLLLLLAAGCLTFWARAQEPTPEPAFAKVPAPPSAEEIAAREAGLETASLNALDTAHQIAASQGYRRRDTRWADALPDEGFAIVPLQLFAGNDYYVILGTDAESENIALSAFDPEHMLVKSAPDRGPGRIVAHITPTVSGRHFLRIHHKQAGESVAHCALTYVYR